MAKLKEIAEITGLSVPTVIHILGTRGHLYREATRQRVLAAANDLGYKPNASAKAMRSGRFGGIGLLLSTARNRSDLPMELLEGIQEKLGLHDLTLSLASLPDQKLTSETYLPKILRELAVDGLIVNYTHFIPADMLKIIGENKIPAVWVNTKHPVDCVYTDDFEASQRATEKLLELGHRRIVYVDFQTVYGEKNLHYSVADRFGGYSAAMNAAGLKPRGVWRDEKLSPAERTALAKELLQSPDRPTAVVSYSAWMDTMPLMIAARDLNLEVPRDLSMITFSRDLFDAWGQPVTTMVIPTREVGEIATDMLLNRINATTEKDQPSKVLHLSMEEGSTLSKAPAA